MARGNRGWTQPVGIWGSEKPPVRTEEETRAHIEGVNRLMDADPALRLIDAIRMYEAASEAEA